MGLEESSRNWPAELATGTLLEILLCIQLAGGNPWLPRDGLRRHLHLRTAGQKIDFELTGARFAKEQPIEVSIAQQRFRFTLETEATGSGEVRILVKGLPAHRYKVVSGKETKEFRPDESKALRLRIPAGSKRQGWRLSGSNVLGKADPGLRIVGKRWRLMTVKLTRRSVLGGLGAGLAETLFVKRVSAAALFSGQAAKPGNST